LPAKLAALFNGLRSRSIKAARADHQLQTKVAKASAKFRREQARLMGSLVQQLGVSAIVKDMTALRERHVRTAIEAMDNAYSAVGDAQTDARKRTRNRKTR
jgi:hypothetical protein